MNGNGTSVDRSRADVALEYAPDPYLCTDLEGRIVAANRAATTQFSSPSEALCGNSLLQLTTEPGRGELQQLLETMRLAPARQRHQFDLCSIAASRRPRPFVARAVRGADDHLHWYLRDESARAGLERELREASMALTFAEERVRSELSRDLHDDVGQLLALVSLMLRKLHADPGATRESSVSEIESVVESISRRVSSLTFQLHPPILYDEGLEAAIAWLCDELRKSHDLDVDLRSRGSLKDLRETERVVMFRSARELLLNVARHAGTTSARVDLSCTSRELRLRVSDTGCGIHGARKGYGLASVCERVRDLGGRFDIAERPEGGTESSIVLPIAGDTGRLRGDGPR